MLDVWFLGSGSAGNATLIVADGIPLLIDAGFSVPKLDARLGRAGFSLRDVKMILLTHGHGDHVKARALKVLADAGGRLLCHKDHYAYLRDLQGFRILQKDGLVDCYGNGPVRLSPSLAVRAVPLSHDFYPTCGFVFDYESGGRRARMAYLADLGRYDRQHVEAAGGADLLALEFNHDEEMERQSGRPWNLIDRVTGPEGHLSNRQAGELLAKILDADGKAPRCLVALHRSSDCNREELVEAAIRRTLGARRLSAQVLHARQDAPLPCIRLCE